MEAQRQHPTATSAQLRLALIELARIDREIQQLEARTRDDHDRDQLTVLRSCRAALLRIANARLPRRPES